MTFPKFIITRKGYLRMGMVNQHRQLLLPGDQCIGGGFYEFDYVACRIVLDRESYDFGRPRWQMIDTLKVPSEYRGMQIVYRRDNNSEHDFDVSGSLKIEYYN